MRYYIIQINLSSKLSCKNDSFRMKLLFNDQKSISENPFLIEYEALTYK